MAEEASAASGSQVILERPRSVPVVQDCDVCVLGGSCTGVFAAVRAAQMGARVALVEKQNAFGGVATSGLVNIWHKLYSNDGTKQIIGGLTYEAIKRLEKIGAVAGYGRGKREFALNTEELKIELDRLVGENGVRPYLHTYYSAPQIEGNKVTAVFVEKQGWPSGDSGEGVRGLRRVTAIWRRMQVCPFEIRSGAAAANDVCGDFGFAGFDRQVDPGAPRGVRFGSGSRDGAVLCRVPRGSGCVPTPTFSIRTPRMQTS